ncbi:MAG: hypothetical protein HY096_00410 [Nitrospinae bacterium]|nr:hypothetical protein [Nitrospinota bacterium]
MTVEQAVMRAIIENVRRGESKIKISEVECAHPIHQLSGRVRLRELRKRGLVDYKYHEEDNTYIIYSTLAELENSWDVLIGKKSLKTSSIIKPTGHTDVHIQKPALIQQRQIKKDENLTVDDLSGSEREEMLDNIRKFRERLEAGKGVAC